MESACYPHAYQGLAWRTQASSHSPKNLHASRSTLNWPQMWLWMGMVIVMFVLFASVWFCDEMVFCPIFIYNFNWYYFFMLLTCIQTSVRFYSITIPITDIIAHNIFKSQWQLDECKAYLHLELSSHAAHFTANAYIMSSCILSSKHAIFTIRKTVLST